MFEQIEKLKRDLTDKYVVVDASAPELRRFAGHVGQVKTVNMNGRALVEFDAWANIGWYDIEPDFLTIVPKPESAVAGKKQEPAAKPAAKAAAAPVAASTDEKKLSPLELARMQGAAKSGTAAPAATKAAPAGEKTAAPAAKAAPAGGAKPSTSDILAAARAKQAAAAPPAAAVAQAAAVEVAAAPAVAEAAAPTPAPAKVKAAAGPALTPGQRPSVPEILAWCRQHDAK